MQTEMEIEHFLHDHPLSLIQDQKDYERFDCNVCEKRLSNPSYGCSYCRFFLHKSCSQIQRQLQHYFHPCPLKLTILLGYDCNACFGHRSGFSFRCEKCDFDLDLECALTPTTVKTEDDDQIQHFTHRHPLQHVDLNKEQDEVYCSICEKLCSDVVYGCKKCKFFLHHSCMDIPQVINQHQFHPKHSLVLLTTPSYNCQGCDKGCSGLAYRCGQCYFELDVKCALLPTADCEGAEWIQHFTHQHPLQLVDAEKEEDEVRCSICRKFCSDLIYGCKKCNLFLHQSCMDIPREINQHPFHPNHSLVLLTKSSYKCKGCDKDCSSLAYKCEPCLFELDVECALLPTANCEGAKRIQHVYHHHPLVLCDEIEDGCKFRCWACRENSPGPHFVCHRCKFFLHQSCAIDVLPQAIQDHPFHPNHCLEIKSYNEEGDNINCQACGYHDSNALAYCCVDCSNFELHLDCSKLTPSIKYGSHRHLFTLFQKIGLIASCFICKDYCESFFLRCVSCDITLHLQCHPLAPKTLKHKDHQHPLNRTKSPPDFNLEYYGFRNEYYCDFCELPRPAHDPVYYCEECDLSADIRCFLSEVLASVTEEDHSGVSEDKDDNFREGQSYTTDPKVVKFDEEIEEVTAELKHKEFKIRVLASVTEEDHSGVSEDKDDNFREGQSYTTDPKVVKFDEEIEEVTAELKHKEFKRKELIAQVQALQSEIKELSNGSRKLEKRRKKLEHKRLSYIAYRTHRLQLKESSGEGRSAEQ